MTVSHIAVVGAGAVGVSCALWLQQDGHQVTLIDPAYPGSGTSSGNACTIADYACVPVNNPALLRQLPSLLFSAESPLSVHPGFAATHIGWLYRFLRHCTRSRVDDSIGALAALLRYTAAGLDPLIQMARAEDLFRNDGCLYVYQTRSAFESAQQDNRRRRESGVQYREVDSAELKELEPGLKARYYKGLLFESARHTVNPLHLVHRFFEQFTANGGGFIQASVDRVSEGGKCVHLTDGRERRIDMTVIAAGAFSTRIKGAKLESVPLGTERGYHVQYAHRQSLLQRPVGWAEAGLYATPTNEGLRFAGTVEIAGLEAPPSERNIQYLRRRALEMFDLDQAPTQTWLGFRPTLPDALPVIDRSKKGNIVYAFGHQHIGLTLAGITGKLVADLAAGRQPHVDLSPYTVDRF